MTCRGTRVWREAKVQVCTITPISVSILVGELMLLIFRDKQVPNHVHTTHRLSEVATLL